MPEPVAPTSATVVPASTTRSTSHSAGRGALSYWNVTSRSSTRPRAAGERLRAGRGGQLRRAVEDLEQARARRGRALRHAEREAELAHRPDQHQQVRVERGEVAEREAPVDHLAPADEQDHRQPDAGQEADERVVERAQPRRLHRLVEHARDRLLEALELARLGRERLHHADARDVLLDVGRQLGDPLLDLLQRGARAAPVAGGDQHHERHREQRQRGQPRLQHEHRDRREQDRQRALGDEDQAVAEEEAHRLQVDGRARHQLAGLLAVEERRFERLQVAVHQVAQVELDRERDAPRDEPACDREAHAQGGRQRDQQGVAAQVALVARFEPVDRAAGEPRDRDRRHHRERREHEREDGACAIWPQEAEQAPESAHATTR